MSNSHDSSGSNIELEALYQQDQRERFAYLRSSFWWGATKRGAAMREIAVRDRWRRKRLLELEELGFLRTGQDYFRAALILQHGECSEDFRRAHYFAQRSVELGYSAGQLVALTCDRLLISEGCPQRYGSQFYRGPFGFYVSRPLANPATRAERQALGLPPLWVSQLLQSTFFNVIMSRLGLIVASLALLVGAYVRIARRHLVGGSPPPRT